MSVDAKCKKLRTRLDGYCFPCVWEKLEEQAVGLKSVRGVE